MNFIHTHILTLTAFLPLLGAIVVSFLPQKRRMEIRITSLAFSAITLILAIKLFLNFMGTGDFEFETAASWVPALGISYRVGVDGVSILMVLLTVILIPVVIGASWKEIKQRVKAFHILVLVLETAMIGTFISLDVFLFYIFWEAVLIPMYFLIGMWGSGNKVRSAIKFVIFTTLGSVIMLVGILYCQSKAGGTFDLIHWYAHVFTAKEQLWLFAAFGLAFAIKLPIPPLHTWLPDAHTDAPTGGSILLAGVLLKMGAYGFFRFAMPLFPLATSFFAPYLTILAVVAIIYGGLLALVQPDMKRLIAYSSVAHMGFVMLGFSALEQNAVQGAALQMFNHGITTGALFMMVGMMYGRTKTRMIADYGGTARTMPLLAVAFIVLALASAGLPAMSTFVGEFLVLLGSFQTRTYFTMVAMLGVIIAASYMLWLIQRVFFGPVKSASEMNPKDLNVREHLLVVPIIVIIIVMGVWPKPWLNKIEKSSQTFLFLARRADIAEAKPAESVDTVPPTEEFIEKQEGGMGKIPEVEIPLPKVEEPTAVDIPPPPPQEGDVKLPPLPAGLEMDDFD
jgi:NADH-quinone oxidoreductase subunit M